MGRRAQLRSVCTPSPSPHLKPCLPLNTCPLLERGRAELSWGCTFPGERLEHAQGTDQEGEHGARASSSTIVLLAGKDPSFPEGQWWCASSRGADACTMR